MTKDCWKFFEEYFKMKNGISEDAEEGKMLEDKADLKKLIVKSALQYLQSGELKINEDTKDNIYYLGKFLGYHWRFSYGTNTLFVNGDVLKDEIRIEAKEIGELIFSLKHDTEKADLLTLLEDIDRWESR